MSAASLFDATTLVLAGPDTGLNSGVAERFLRPQPRNLPPYKAGAH